MWLMISWTKPKSFEKELVLVSHSGTMWANVWMSDLLTKMLGFG